jgi:hypothetical protein
VKHIKAWHIHAALALLCKIAFKLDKADWGMLGMSTILTVSALVLLFRAEK